MRFAEDLPFSLSRNAARHTGAARVLPFAERTGEKQNAFEFSNPISCKKSVAALSENLSNRFTVANDDKLSRILDGLKSAAVEFCQEGLSPDISVDIAQVAADHTTVSRGLGAEEV